MKLKLKEMVSHTENVTTNKYSFLVPALKSSPKTRINYDKTAKE